jgi:hypothetical protein
VVKTVVKRIDADSVLAEQVLDCRFDSSDVRGARQTAAYHGLIGNDHKQKARPGKFPEGFGDSLEQFYACGVAEMVPVGYEGAIPV